MNDRKQIRVSYLITTRNRAQYLQRTLDNVREFITPEDELIIFDGASTDETRLVAEKNKDIITLFVSEPDKGEAHGLNRGILASRGEYIKFLTDDDYFYPEAMRTLIDILDSHPEVDALISGGECYVFDDDSNSPRLFHYSYLPPEYSLIDNFNLHFAFVACGLGLLLKRKVIEIAGILDTSFISVDLEYIARLTFSDLGFKFANINLYKHYRHPHSISSTFAIANKEMLRIRLRYLKTHVSQKELSAKIDNIINTSVSNKHVSIVDASFSKIKHIICVIKHVLKTFLPHQFYSQTAAKYHSMQSKKKKSPDPIINGTNKEGPVFDGSIRG